MNASQSETTAEATAQAAAQAAEARRGLRSDGTEKVTGSGRYTADLTRTGQTYAKFRYTDHSHARIVSINTDAARAVPGVVAIITQADVPMVKIGSTVQDRTLFANEVVRFEGEIIAAVAAMTPDIAERAAALIQVEYEPLPVVTNFVTAMNEGTQLVHHDWESDERAEGLGSQGNTLGHSTIVKGNAAKAFEDTSLTVVKSTYTTDPSHGVPIEPRAVLAEWQGNKVTIWSSSQVPYAARGTVATALEIPQANVRVIVPLLGGGFGSKCDHHFEAHIAALSKAVQRPVKLVFSRKEEFFAIGHRREGMHIELETAVTKDGHMVARRGQLFLDKGAYCGEGGFFAQMAAMHACGPYVIDHIDVHSYLNYTNNQPSSSIRAPTAPQVCWAVEQHTDEIARAIGLDPVELRLRTLIEEGAEGPTRQVFDQIGMKDSLRTAAEMIGYGQPLPDDEAIGISSGWWPCFAVESGAYVKLNHDGTGTIITGAQENGSGAVMAMANLVADQLGMTADNFSILYQDTDAAPWDMGSSGSQTTFNSVRAVLDATADVRNQLIDAAAEQLEAAPEDLELVEGSVRVKGSPTKAVAIAALAAGGTFHGKGSGPLPESPPVQAEGCIGRMGMESFLAPQVFTHAVRVRVDRDTGVVEVLQVAAAHDSGAILNRMGADGQVYGGVVMGIGQAISEGTLLDDQGRQRNPHLLDYKLVTCADAPKIDIAWVGKPTPGAGPLGSKGVGEPPSVPTAGAIANAITKVIGAPVRHLPMTPERVWAATNGGAR